jgi:MSHA biogenesis protein MshM
MYCEYWNLHKAPFDNVPDPSMYADCHASMENVISETIFAIKEAHEDFAVIIGAAGLGKTLALRMIIGLLEPDQYQVVIITNPGISFTQLLKEIISQITGKPCEENRKVDLLEIFHRLLSTTMGQGQKIVILIDEANTLSPANLENLRLLTNMQVDQRNLFTIVLAGQMELAQRLEHPKRANLFQRIGTYGRIDKLPSEEAVQKYIETRLKLAGMKTKIFSDDCVPVIWEYSEHGVPRLINKICKLCLKAGETNNFDYISSDTVLHISERFQKLSKTAVQKRKPRSKPKDMEISDIVVLETQLEEALLNPTITYKETQHEMDETVLQTISKTEPERITLKTDISVGKVPEGTPLNMSLPTMLIDTQPKPEVMTLPATIPDEERLSEVAKPLPVGTSDVKMEQDNFKDEKHPQDENENYDDVMIGKHKIHLAIPEDILKQVKSFNRESANKSAGFWAAQIIKNNPQLTHSPLVDPVNIWNEIKDSILKKIGL